MKRKIEDQHRANKDKGKTLTLKINVWAKRGGKDIRIRMAGLDGGVTTVSSNPKSKRHHKTLFRRLRNELVKNDRWQFGDEGSET